MNVHRVGWWQKKEILNKKLSGTRFTFSILPKVRIVMQLINYRERLLFVSSKYG
ncbi:hypothetical protein MARI151_50173 [Maribacter litoralis]|uniref:Uncharacterized protein n=1 Tax=Maribacter litoralis TaxID=2059726 RepID=A0A653V3V7_9FLAO|nr:hypothetical protein MARI151_50173 [Maribacter litoralis]